MLKSISKFFSLIVFVLLAKITLAQVTLTNPILTGFYPDPSIVKVGADYYSVHSTFSYFPGLPVMHSRDLKNWKQIERKKEMKNNEKTNKQNKTTSNTSS